MDQEELELMAAEDAAADAEWADLLAEHEQHDREEAGEDGESRSDNPM